MYKIENSRLVAAISISILLASVLCNPIQSIFADSTKEQLQKQKQSATEKANEYLHKLGAESRKDTTKPHYSGLNSTTSVGSGKDRKVEIEKAKQASDEKARKTLEKMYPKLAQKKYGS